MKSSRLYTHLVSRRDVLNWAGRSAAFATFLSATRSLPAVAQDAPLLRIWMGEDYVPAWNAYLPVMIKKVAAELGVRVELELTPDNDTGRARRQTALESDTLPDIIHGTTADSAKYYGLGKLHPIAADVFERMKSTNGGWLDNIEAFVTADDGKIYGVPFFTRPWLVHYRQDIFDKAGIKVPPATLDDLKAAAKEVHNPNEGIYGVGMPYNQADMDGHMVAFPWLYNGSWQDAHGKLTVETPENLAALKSYLWFFQEGLTPQDSLNWGGSGNNNAYLTGLAAIVNNTGSLFAALQRDRPDLAEVTTLGPWPQAIPDGKPASTTIGFCLNIAHNSPNAELAGKFIEKMLDVENMGPLLEAGSGQAMPVRKNLTEIEYFQKDPIVGRIVREVVPYSRPLTSPGPNNAPFADLVSNNSPYFKDMLHRVLVNNVSPEESLKQFAAEGDALVKKYQK
ncbi:ABC transporter substrate-binding protein [Rhizobium binxianense]